MIFDRMENLGRYGRALAQAAEAVRAFDAETAPGRYPVVPEKLYVSVFDSATNAAADSVWEFHREFADVQILLDGAEDCYITPRELTGLREKSSYDETADYALFHLTPEQLEQAVRLRLEPGVFAMIRPGEGHVMSVNTGNESRKLKKAVVKIHRSLLV